MNKKCIKCGIRLHPTDWIILKEMNTLPICDYCLFEEEESNKPENGNVVKSKNIIHFPVKSIKSNRREE
jgi:hypothetical protein